MKRQIRYGVFETNSSSSHSVSIHSKKDKILYDIPKDSEVVLNDDYLTGKYIDDELGKLNYVVKMLATIVEDKDYDDEIEIKSFEEMINLNWFKWLAEVVKEESNTKVIYECPKHSRLIPYYDTTWDEQDTIEEIFTNYDSSVLNDEAKFKERVKFIIYDPTVVIEDEEDEW